MCSRPYSVLQMFLTTRVNTFLGCTDLSRTYVYGDVFTSNFSVMYGLSGAGPNSCSFLITWFWLCWVSVGARAFSVVAEGEGGPEVACGLTAAAALVAERGLQVCALQ